TTGGSAAPCGGTLGYAAPEALHPSVGQYTSSADIWSLGATFFYMLTMQNIYDSLDMPAAGQRKLGHPLDVEAFRLMSTEACDLIKVMLTEDPKQRISAESALEHAWLKDYQYQPTIPAITNASEAYSDLTPTERCSPPPHELIQGRSAQIPSPSVEFKPLDVKCPSCHQKISSRVKNLTLPAPLLKCIKCRKLDQKNLTRVRTEQKRRRPETTRRILKPGRL
ncbi:kinase-like protein, partial [Agrocybe pediades]